MAYVFNPFTGNFDSVESITIGTANGLSLVGSALSLGLSSAGAPGALSAADWTTFNAKQAAGTYLTALTGDATASGPGSAALTFATVNANVGSFGGATAVGSFTVNAKGLITAASSTSIQIAESQVTNLVSDLAGKQPTGNYITALTGDATASGPGSAALTLATVNAGVGSFGSASSVSAITVNAKGLVTAAASTSIQIAESQVTGLTADLAAKVATASLGNLTDVGTDGIVITGGTGAVVGSVSIAQHVADATHSGYLSSTDWNTFSSGIGAAITSLTGDATASGPGAAALTFATVNGNVGSFGSASSVSAITVNAKGLVTAAASTSIQIAESQVTNLVSDLAGKQATGNYITALTGDIAASGPGSAAATLATVNGNVGSFGSSTSIPSLTVNAKGLVTAASGNAVVAPAGTLSGTTLNATVVSSSLTSVGTIATGTWQGTAVDATHGGTAQTSYATGDTLYASASNTLSKLTVGANGTFLRVAAGIPSYTTINLTDWTSFTPTGSWNTNVTYTGRQRRVGDTLECQVRIVLSGAPNAAALSVNLPSGLTVDTAKILITSSLQPLGRGKLQDAGTDIFEDIWICYGSTGAVMVSYGLVAATSGTEAQLNSRQVSDTAPVTFASGDNITFTYSVPISGWSAFG